MKQPYTEAQVSHWSKWPNITAHYRVLAPYLKEAFQWKGKNINDYNRFVGDNLMAPAVYISKQLSKQRGGVAACYTVSEGSLESIVVTGSGSTAQTNIGLGDYKLTAQSTVKDFAKAVVTNNSQYEYGDAITFLLVRQETHPLTEIPILKAEGQKVKLSATDERLLQSVAPGYGFSQSTDGHLAVAEEVPQGVYAWIHSRMTKGGKLLVSQQMLIDNNPLMQEYMEDTAKMSSMQSYGLKEDVFLAPDSGQTTTGGGSTESGSGSGSDGGGSEVDPDNPLG